MWDMIIGLIAGYALACIVDDIYHAQVLRRRLGIK